MSSGWFDCTEPSLTTSLEGKQSVQGSYALVRGVQLHRTSSNLLELHHYRESKVCRVLLYEFGVVRLYRTSITTSLEGKQFVQDAYALVRGSSSASNLLEPS